MAEDPEAIEARKQAFADLRSALSRLGQQREAEEVERIVAAYAQGVHENRHRATQGPKP